MKTHSIIENKILRYFFAKELNELRLAWHGLDFDFSFNEQEMYMFKLGMESGFWSIQKFLNKFKVSRWLPRLLHKSAKS